MYNNGKKNTLGRFHRKYEMGEEKKKSVYRKEDKLQIISQRIVRKRLEENEEVQRPVRYYQSYQYLYSGSSTERMGEGDRKKYLKT